MIDTMKLEIVVASDDYLATPRKDWVKKHYGQCVLNCSQIHWTQETATAIVKHELPQ